MSAFQHDDARCAKTEQQLKALLIERAITNAHGLSNLTAAFMEFMEVEEDEESGRFKVVVKGAPRLTVATLIWRVGMKQPHAPRGADVREVLRPVIAQVIAEAQDE